MSTFFYGRGWFQRPALPNGFRGRAGMSPRPFLRASQATPLAYARPWFLRPARPLKACPGCATSVSSPTLGWVGLQPTPLDGDATAKTATKVWRDCAESETNRPHPSERAPSSDDEIDQLARHHDRLADLLAVELHLDAGRRLRLFDQLGLG